MKKIKSCLCGVWIFCLAVLPQALALAVPERAWISGGAAASIVDACIVDERGRFYAFSVAARRDLSGLFLRVHERGPAQAWWKSSGESGINETDERVDEAFGLTDIKRNFIREIKL